MLSSSDFLGIDGYSPISFYPCGLLVGYMWDIMRDVVQDLKAESQIFGTYFAEIFSCPAWNAC